MAIKLYGCGLELLRAEPDFCGDLCGVDDMLNDDANDWPGPSFRAAVKESNPPLRMMDAVEISGFSSCSSSPAIHESDSLTRATPLEALLAPSITGTVDCTSTPSPEPTECGPGQSLVQQFRMDFRKPAATVRRRYEVLVLRRVT